MAAACAHAPPPQEAQPPRAAVDLDAARAQLRAAIEAEPDDGEAYRDLLHLEVSTGNLPAARGVAEKLEAAAREHTVPGNEADDDVTGEEAVTGSRLRENASSAWV